MTSEKSCPFLLNIIILTIYKRSRLLGHTVSTYLIMAGLEIDLETVFIEDSLICRIRGKSGNNKIICNSVSFLHFDSVTLSNPFQGVITRGYKSLFHYFKSPFHWFLSRAKRDSLRQLFLFRDLICKFGLAIFVSFVEKCTVWVSLPECRR